MAEDLIRYDVLAQEALRGLVKKVLTEVAQAGLPGEHHFFITFNTRYPGVRISSRLAARISGRDDDRAAASVLGPHGHRFGLRGRAFLQGRAGETACAVPRDHELRRSAREFALKFDIAADAVAGAAAEAEGAAEEVPRPDTGQGGREPGRRRRARSVPKRPKNREDQDGEAAAVVSLDAFRKKNG